MKNVVVIFGNMGHGKDTLGEILGTIWSQETIAFATPVKEVGKALVGIPKAISHGTQEDKATWQRFGRSAREWLQWIGTELGRDMIDKDIWVRRAADTIMDGTEQNFVITDGRFENERTKLKEFLTDDHRVTNVKIIRPDVPINHGHPSEDEVAAMDPELFDHVVMNDGSLDDLRTEAGTLVDWILGLGDRH